MTEPSLEQLISAAIREVTTAKLARPRDQARIDAAIAEVERLRELRDA